MPPSRKQLSPVATSARRLRRSSCTTRYAPRDDPGPPRRRSHRRRSCAQHRCGCPRRRHARPAQRRESRAPAIQNALPQGPRDRPDATTRVALARRATPGDSLDLQRDRLEDVGEVEVVVNVIGGEIVDRSAELVRSGGALVTIAERLRVRPDGAGLVALQRRLRDGPSRPPCRHSRRREPGPGR